MAFPSGDYEDRFPATVAASGADQGATEAAIVDGMIDGDAALNPSTVRPAMRVGRAEALIMNVNGPELEAVLDLMETQDTEDPLLSI